jgi:hypothetical protein
MVRSRGPFFGPTAVGVFVNLYPSCVHRSIESIKTDTFFCPNFSSSTNASAASFVSPAPDTTTAS